METRKSSFDDRSCFFVDEDGAGKTTSRSRGDGVKSVGIPSFEASIEVTATPHFVVSTSLQAEGLIGPSTSLTVTLLRTPGRGLDRESALASVGVDFLQP